MRFALCISGYFSNKNGDDLLLSNYIQSNIIDLIEKDHTLDIFIYSFDINNRGNIEKKYPNATLSIDDQINFIDTLNDSNKEYYKKMLSIGYEKCGVYNIQSTLSFIYSRCESIKMALEHSKKDNFEYDSIIRTRFDVGVRLKDLKDENRFGDRIIFDTNLDFNYFYSAYWDQLNAGYVDHWAFSNQENMEIFSKMYDYLINNMLILDSDYIKTLNVWPDSSQNKKSNEILSVNKIPNNQVKYDFKYSSNNHIIQKYFIMNTTLYEKSAFLDYRNDTQTLYRIPK